MKLLTLILIFVTFALGLPVTAPVTRETDSLTAISSVTQDRPVFERADKVHLISSQRTDTRALTARQRVVPGAFIIEFKQGYVLYLVPHSCNL